MQRRCRDVMGRQVTSRDTAWRRGRHVTLLDVSWRYVTSRDVTWEFKSVIQSNTASVVYFFYSTQWIGNKFSVYWNDWFFGTDIFLVEILVDAGERVGCAWRFLQTLVFVQLRGVTVTIDCVHVNLGSTNALYHVTRRFREAAVLLSYVICWPVARQRTLRVK